MSGVDRYPPMPGSIGQYYPMPPDRYPNPLSGGDGYPMPGTDRYPAPGGDRYPMPGGDTPLVLDRQILLILQNILPQPATDTLKMTATEAKILTEIKIDTIQMHQECMVTTDLHQTEVNQHSAIRKIVSRQIFSNME